MFRVVADQLKISEGWVRCGHCADVFDATLYLQPWIPPGEGPASEEFVAAAPEPVFEPEPEPRVEPEPAIEPEPEPERHQDAELDNELSQELDGTSVERAMVPDVLLDEPMWEAGESFMDERAVETVPPPLGVTSANGSVTDDAESDFQAELKRFAAGLGRLKEGSANTVADAASDAAASAMPDAPAPQEAQDAEDRPSSELDAPDAVPGFVRQAQRQAFWSSRGVRAALASFALVLAALFAGQWAVHERDRLAAWKPELQPVLQQICDRLGCKLAPMRRIDAIVIDSTSLVRRLGNFYSFDLVLKNTASMALAVPALELSLTDIGGDVISRRVFLPEEWPDAPAQLPAQASVTINFRLSLALGDDTPMAGYHALVFYP